MPHASSRRTKTLVSALILVVLALHALPVLSYQGVRQTRWPFLAWGMYAKAHAKGPIQAQERRLTGLTASGQKQEITGYLLGLSRPSVRMLYLIPINRGDTAVAESLLVRVNKGREDPIVELRVEGVRYTLADTGVVTEPLPVVSYRPIATVPSR